MDERADDLQQSIAETRHDIEETRASMTEKLELLEERVRDTLEETKTAVGDIVENVKGTVDETVGAVKETVDGAKSTVEDIVENVKGTMDDTVTMVKQSFDLRYQVEQHPWLMLGGSVIAGSMLASFMDRGRDTRRSPYRTYDDPGQYVTDTTKGWKLYSVTGKENGVASEEHSVSPAVPQQRSWTGMLGQFQEEFDVVKGAITGAVISTVTGTLQEMIRQNIPSMASNFDKAMKRIANKWGVEPKAASTNYEQAYDESGQAKSTVESFSS